MKGYVILSSIKPKYKMDNIMYIYKTKLWRNKKWKK